MPRRVYSTPHSRMVHPIQVLTFAVGGTRVSRLRDASLLQVPMSLRGRYAMSGTDIRYGPQVEVCHAAMSSVPVIPARTTFVYAYQVRAHYAMPSTKLACGTAHDA
eukprot:37063-Rhodomonas_salina.2